MDERGSLDNLRDIVTPAAPPQWPPAPEVWVVCVLAALTVVIALYYWRQRRAASAYRRAGLSLLADAGTHHDISVILKRVALAAYPRERVASLYGAAWRDFLSSTCAKVDISSLVQCAPDTPADATARRQAALWIRHHRVTPEQGDA